MTAALPAFPSTTRVTDPSQVEAARKELEKEAESEGSAEPAEPVSLLKMFRTPNLRLNAFLCTVIW
jgi:hypothetical protein